MTKEGQIVHSRYDKYRQINRFLEFIEDILPQLDKHKENVIIDFGWKVLPYFRHVLLPEGIKRISGYASLDLT